MLTRIHFLGFFSFLSWFFLLIPELIGFWKGYKYESIRKDYLNSVNYNSSTGEFLLLLVVFTLTFFFYIKAIKACHRAGFLSVFSWAGIITLILILLPPFTCEDVYYYIATGQMQSAYNVNPYLNNAHQIPNWKSDPLLSTTGWGFLLSMYGPIWTMVTKGLVSISGDNLLLATFLFKALAGMLHLINMIIIGGLAKELRNSQVQAMVIYGWNPLLLFEMPGHAHNDALLIFFLLLAIFMVAKGRELFSVPLLTISIMVKYVPILIMPLLSIYLILRRKYLPLLGGIALSLLLIPLTWAPYWEGFKTLNGIFKQFEFYSIKSLHSLIYLSFHSLLPELPKNIVFETSSFGLNLVFVGLVCLLLFRFSKNRQNLIHNLVLTSLALFVLFLLISNKWYQPWYISWVVPLVAAIYAPKLMPLLLLSYTAEISRLPQILIGNTGLHVQVITFCIAWLPLLLCYRNFISEKVNQL